MADSFEAIALRESKLRTQWLPMKTAVQEIVAFEKLFGEGHLLLACHAALPSLLTVELLHFIRLNFLDQQPRAPWIAEMDFLLSSLCRQIEDDLFEVEPMVREALLFELQERYGWGRLLDVASFLLEYLHKRQESRQNPSVAQLHEWIAQAYLDPNKVIEELTKLFDESLNTEQNAYQTLPKKLQIARAMELLAEPLEHTTLQEKYQDLLHGARVLAYVIYENKEKIRATPLYTAKQAPDEQGKRLFSPTMQQWLATIAANQVVTENIEIPPTEVTQPLQDEAIEIPPTEVTQPLQDEAEENIADRIDKRLRQAGWEVVRDNDEFQNTTATGIAIREFPLMNNKLVDYLLVINGEAVGIIDVKGEDIHPVVAISPDRKSVAVGIGGEVRMWQIPTAIRFQRTHLPFSYEVNGYEIQFTNYLEPEARSRRVFHFHRPETFVLWLEQAPIGTPNELNDLLRSRLRRMPPIADTDLSNAQYQAIINLERSLVENHPRTLIQMAVGKVDMAVKAIDHLLRFSGAKRILYIVDRVILAAQISRRFTDYDIPTHSLENEDFASKSGLYITTIQRLHNVLFNNFNVLFNNFNVLFNNFNSEQTTYNPSIPIEFFDIIFIDECHRSIYNEWRASLEYFDAFLVGLTATPDDRTLAFFNDNLVYEYSQTQAVADGMAVNYQIYRIPIELTEQGSTVELGSELSFRDQPTGIRARAHERLEEDSIYKYLPLILTRDMIAISQIRTVISTYKDILFTELFPGRSEVPKTIIFAKNESHADDIIQIVREVFGRENEFATKLTSKATNRRPEHIIRSFQLNYYPRIIVIVNMFTGIDFKPVEVLVFLRAVRSRTLFMQMISLGGRTISDEELHKVTPDAHSKTHCVILDAVGVTEYLGFEAPSSIEEISGRFTEWLEDQQHTREQPFTEEQIRWLERIRDLIASDQKFEMQDFNRPPFEFDGGLVAARQLFGRELTTIVRELNEKLGNG